MFAAFIDRKPAPCRADDLRLLAAHGGQRRERLHNEPGLRGPSGSLHVTFGRPWLGDRMARISTPGTLTASY